MRLQAFDEETAKMKDEREDKDHEKKKTQKHTPNHENILSIKSPTPIYPHPLPTRFLPHLLVPAEPVAVLEVDHRAPRLQLFPEVRLHQSLEGVDAQRVDQILHARIGPDLAVPVVALGRQNALAQLHHVVLLGGDRRRGRRGRLGEDWDNKKETNERKK